MNQLSALGEFATAERRDRQDILGRLAARLEVEQVAPVATFAAG